MNKISRRAYTANGKCFRVQVDLRSQLNYSYLNLTEQTYLVGEYGVPAVYCNTDVFPDYLALYSQSGYYHKTPLTAVCFYQYDLVFDGVTGSTMRFTITTVNCFPVIRNGLRMSVFSYRLTTLCSEMWTRSAT